MNRTITHSDPKFHKNQKVKLTSSMFNEKGVILKRYYDIDEELYLYKVKLDESNEEIFAFGDELIEI